MHGQVAPSSAARTLPLMGRVGASAPGWGARRALLLLNSRMDGIQNRIEICLHFVVPEPNDTIALTSQPTRPFLVMPSLFFETMRNAIDLDYKF